MDFLWNLMQHYDIAQNRSDIRDAKRQAESAKEHLSERIDALILANAAMWSLLKEHLGVTDEQLTARMKQIDFSAGILDAHAIRKAKLAATFGVCPGCQRQVSLRTGKCMYCGESLQGVEAIEHPEV